MTLMTNVLLLLAFLLILITIYDLLQKKHAILRNFPIIGHLRYLLESVGPELRQYIVTNNNEERPFSRDERRWIYASAKKQNDEFGFGTDQDLELTSNYLIIKQSAFPYRDPSQKDWSSLGYPIPCAKILGGSRRRKHAFRPKSIVNISAMSFGSLSGRAIESLNKGSVLADCLHNTGEGGISKHHLHKGDLIWNIGSGYFGCRDEAGQFSLDRLKEAVSRYPVKAIEIKLSQGAKPGLGGLLPAKKVTADIAKARGIPMGKSCLSPSRHSAFQNVDELLDFVELIADTTGLPVGIKSAVGQLDFWSELCESMSSSNRGVDFVTIDGGEGGTGAAPLVFADHVALPFKMAFTSVYKIFASHNLHNDVVFIGSGKLGLTESACFALAMGADMIAIARESMLAIGCIQAQACHNNRCPTGIATQSKWLSRGLDPDSKAERFANYVSKLRKEILRISWTCGVSHPALIHPSSFAILDNQFHMQDPRDVFGYKADWGVPNLDQTREIQHIMNQPE